MKKALSLLLASLGCLALSGCDEGSSERISVWNSISRGEPLPDVVLSLDLAKRQRIDEACINVRVGHSPRFLEHWIEKFDGDFRYTGDFYVRRDLYIRDEGVSGVKWWEHDSRSRFANCFLTDRDYVYSLPEDAKDGRFEGGVLIEDSIADVLEFDEGVFRYSVVYIDFVTRLSDIEVDVEPLLIQFETVGDEVTFSTTSEKIE